MYVSTYFQISVVIFRFCFLGSNYRTYLNSSHTIFVRVLNFQIKFSYLDLLQLLLLLFLLLLFIFFLFCFIFAFSVSRSMLLLVMKIFAYSAPLFLWRPIHLVLIPSQSPRLAHIRTTYDNFCEKWSNSIRSHCRIHFTQRPATQ